MEIKNLTRLLRYLVGLLFTSIGVLGLILIGIFNNTIISIICIIISLPCLMWGAILIGRCEEFIENKFNDNKNPTEDGEKTK